LEKNRKKFFCAFQLSKIFCFRFKFLAQFWRELVGGEFGRIVSKMQQNIFSKIKFFFAKLFMQQISKTFLETPRQAKTRQPHSNTPSDLHKNFHNFYNIFSSQADVSYYLVEDARLNPLTKDLFEPFFDIFLFEDFEARKDILHKRR